MTTENHLLITSLTHLGFEENEAAIYLASLELGQAAVWDIALKSGVKRPTCYVILEKFLARGIASHAKDGKRTLFSVISPKELLSSFERRTSQLAERLSELEGLASTKASKPTIRLFEGKNGMEQAYDLALIEPKSTVCIYGTGEIFATHPEYFEHFTKMRVKNSIKSRALVADTPENRALNQADHAVQREIRFLPAEKFNPKQEVLIFGNTIAYIAVLDKEPFATVVESKLFADGEKERFELLWEMASE